MNDEQRNIGLEVLEVVVKSMTGFLLIEAIVGEKIINISGKETDNE